MNRERPQRGSGRVRGAGVSLVLLAIAVVLVWVWRALVAYAPATREAVAIESAPGESATTRDTLTLLTWNLGFASLGREMDFVADGGKQRRAASAARVRENLDAIVQRLQAEHADVELLQEVAEASWLTHGVDMRQRLRAGAGAFAHSPMVNVTGLPPLGRLVVGQAVRSRVGIASAARLALPSVPHTLGITLQHYHVLETRLPAADSAARWVLLDMHLAAFDDGSLRRAQLAEVIRLAQARHAEGFRVIAGGDWNLRLAPTAFPATADPAHAAWLRELPADAAPPGWQWAVDPRTATNRTLEAPYVPGVNHTQIIDGFLVSPDVEVLSVETRDLGFEPSDHHPVVLRVRAR